MAYWHGEFIVLYLMHIMYLHGFFLNAKSMYLFNQNYIFVVICIDTSFYKNIMYIKRKLSSCSFSAVSFARQWAISKEIKSLLNYLPQSSCCMSWYVCRSIFENSLFWQPFYGILCVLYTRQFRALNCIIILVLDI